MLVANEGLEGFPTKSTENVIYLVVIINGKGFASQNAAIILKNESKYLNYTSHLVQD